MAEKEAGGSNITKIPFLATEFKKKGFPKRSRRKVNRIASPTRAISRLKEGGVKKSQGLKGGRSNFTMLTKVDPCGLSKQLKIRSKEAGKKRPPNRGFLSST